MTKLFALVIGYFLLVLLSIINTRSVVHMVEITSQ